MTKKRFIALADMVREHNSNPDFKGDYFSGQQLALLADFCKAFNPNFKEERWMDYIEGKCGKNGGKVKVNA